MRLASVAQAIQIDEVSQKVYGLTGEILMESAGALAAREIDLSYLPELTRGRLFIVCGPGNNGGDGMVVARHLHSSGHRNIEVLLIAPAGSQSALLKRQRERAELQGIKVIDLLQQPEALETLANAEVIVDALFGIGLNKKISDLFLKVIEAMNATKAPKISIDAPSGLNCDTGRVDGIAVRAAMTVTFGLAKAGFFVGDGPSHVGRLRVLPIGFPHEALRGIATSHFLFTEKLARRYLPSRENSSNKSDHGRLLVLAGHSGMWGAGVLASTSGFRMGAGYVTWASFDNPVEAIKEIPEVLTGRIQDDQIWAKRPTAVAVGPGLGVSRETADLIERLKKIDRLPVVVDADAITACVDYDLFPLPPNWVITPHSGELARILKIQANEVEKDRFRAAMAGFDKTQCHVLLKGFRSLVAFDQRFMVIHSGNSALAKAGTGDVLTGMIGALLAQGVDTPQATATAAYLHGRLADEWVRSGQDKASLTASDLKAILPQVLSRLRLGGALG